MDGQSFRVGVHREAGGYWAQVESIPGCFASGQTLDELCQALHESIALFVGEDEPERILTRVTGLTIDAEPDLRPFPDPPTRPRSSRKRQSHREDWPPR